MAEINANVVVSMPSQLFTSARSFRAVANGRVYVGKTDTDPTIISNQIPVYIQNEDGSTIQIPQPIIINAGGFPVYGGQIVKVVTVQSHSMAVYDAYGMLEHYYPDVLKYDPDQFSKRLASTSLGEGASLVGDSLPTPNAIGMTVHDILLPFISIQRYGGKDDYDGTTVKTNSFQALLGIMADFPNGCRIYMPRTVGGTGHYYMEGNTGAGDMSKYVIDPDYTVQVTHKGANTPLVAKGLVVTRPLNIRLLTAGYTYYLSATAYGQVASKPYIMSQGDGEAPVLERLLPNDPNTFFFNSLNISTGAQASISATTDTETAAMSNIGSGGFSVGSVPIRPGQEVHAQVTLPNMSGSIGAYVQTESGWVLFSQDLTGGTITRRVFLEGFSVQSTTISDPLADNPAYMFVSSEVGIKVHSPTSFSLLMNHVEIARMDGLTSNIIRAGWGAGLVNATTPAYITYPTKLRNNATYGMRPLKIVISGDSTADYNNTFSWVNHMVRAASGAGGVQFKNILNLAVAGQTSLQQAQIFNTTDFQSLGGFDYALIDIGINDIGGGSTPSQFISSIVSMINVCTTYNMTPIIGLPAMFYNQSAATPYSQTGQNSANADRGAPYRLQLLRKLAELNVQVAMLPIQDMGAIVPSLLSNKNLNPVVQDNVHQSNWGAELKGQGWAKSFIGYLFSRVRTDISSRTIKASWIPSAISATYGVAAKPSYEIVGNEFGLTGLMDTPASVPDGTVLMQLPQAYAPKTQIYIPLTCQDASNAFLGSVATLRIDTNGTVAVRGAPATSRYFFFGNCRYTLQQ